MQAPSVLTVFHLTKQNTMHPYQNIAIASHHAQPFFRNGITYVMQTSPTMTFQTHYKDIIRP